MYLLFYGEGKHGTGKIQTCVSTLRVNVQVLNQIINQLMQTNKKICTALILHAKYFYLYTLLTIFIFFLNDNGFSYRVYFA